MSSKQRYAFVNGKIFTSDAARPRAQAMLAENGIITWVGEERELPVGSAVRVDLEGKRVLPGFVDAHMHPALLAECSQQISCLPPKIYSIAELIGEIRRVRAVQGPGAWIRGWGYDEGKFTERRAPTRRDLDQGCGDAPVAILRTCAHIYCVNSRALELAHITRDTPDPPGGKIDRDEDGEPTGILRENARYLLQEVLPPPDTGTLLDQLADLGKLLLSQGVTAVTDMGFLDERDGYPIYRAAAERGFRQRVGIYYLWDYLSGDPDCWITPERLDKNQKIRVAGVKLIGDGSVSGRTAWMSRPYSGSGGDCGLPVCTPEEIDQAIRLCREKRCQLAVHAMGGQAIDRIVDRAYGEADWLGDGTPCLRIEHVTEPSERAIARAAERKFAFATQPIFPYCEIESYLANLGPERTRQIYPVRTLLERGVPVCFSTDAPATSWAVPSDPFPCIKSAVTRRAWDGTDFGRDQRVSVETALRLYTSQSAQIAGFKGIGQLKPGCSADFIVLDRDILAVPEEELDAVQVDRTYIAGELEFERSRL